MSPFFGKIASLFMILYSVTTAQQDTVRLRYEDYLEARIFHGINHSVDLSRNASAKVYKTVLKQAAKDGPNFAGHYTIAIWGCGTSSQAFAIINAITGKVYFSKELPYASWSGWYGDEYGLQYRLDSRLLVIYGRRKEEEPSGIFYYEWKNEKLKFKKFIANEVAFH